MPKTAVMVRLSDEELSALDALALRSGISRATCAMSILRQRLSAPNLTEQPMMATPLAPKGDVPRGTSRAYQVDPADCAHKYAHPGKPCPACGLTR